MPSFDGAIRCSSTAPANALPVKRGFSSLGCSNGLARALRRPLSKGRGIQQYKSTVCPADGRINQESFRKEARGLPYSVRGLRPIGSRFLEGWYNPHRLHSALGNCSPLVYEQRQAEAQRNAVASDLPTAGRRRGRQRRPAARPWTTRATLPTGANSSMINSTA